MFGRVTRVQVRPGSDIAEKGRQLWFEELLPALKTMKGYRGATVLVPNQENAALSLVIWDSVEDADAAQNHPDLLRIAGKFAPLLTAEPARETYAIAIDERAGK